MINQLITKSESATIKLGKKLINDYYPDINLIIIIGDIGAGKTMLVKGMAKGLNITDNISSPTFSVKKVYKNLVHYDLYFANKKELKLNEFNSLISEDLNNNIVVIEWGDKLTLRKLKNYLKVKINVIDGKKRNVKWELIKE